MDAIFLCLTAIALVLLVLTKNGTRYNRFFPWCLLLRDVCRSCCFLLPHRLSENKAVLNLLNSILFFHSHLSSFSLHALSVFWSYYLNWLLVWLHPTWRLQRECLGVGSSFREEGRKKAWQIDTWFLLECSKGRMITVCSDTWNIAHVQMILEIKVCLFLGIN